MQLRSPTLEDVKEEEGLIRQKGWRGTFGDFYQRHERALVLGGTQHSEDCLCSPCISGESMNI